MGSGRLCLGGRLRLALDVRHPLTTLILLDEVLLSEVCENVIGALVVLGLLLGTCKLAFELIDFPTGMPGLFLLLLLFGLVLLELLFGPAALGPGFKHVCTDAV